MTEFVFWLYGALSIGSLFMCFAWGAVATAFMADRPPHRSARLVIALSLVLHAFVMTWVTAYRAVDMARGASIIGSEAWVLALALFGLFLSKVGLVWAGSLPSVPDRHVRWPWPLFIACLTVWLMFVIVWFW